MAENLDSLQPGKQWSDYIIGVAKELLKLGKRIQPLDIAIYSTVPVDSGLSSSASIEVSSALAMLFGQDIDKTKLALLCQRAEREFVPDTGGTHGNEHVSVYGEENRAIKIDCPAPYARDGAASPGGSDHRGELHGEA